MRQKYLWQTDTHLFPWMRYDMLNAIRDAKPHGVFLTGDISNGPTLIGDLRFMAKRAGRPIYFVLGNHDYWFSSIEKVHNNLKQLCDEYKNLIWVDRSEVIELNEETGLVGCTGFYDGRVGKSNFIKFTFDWFLIKELRELNWKQRFEKFQDLADTDTKIVSEKLEKALDMYKAVILLTHFPPFAEANRCDSWLSEEFWASYNCNYQLGKSIEKIMAKHKKRQLTVLCGHTHSPMSIHVGRNIICQVGRGSYNHLTDDQTIYI